LLVTPDRIEGELFIYGDGRISLGPFSLEDNKPVPTWREYLAQRIGRPIETRSDIIASGYPDLTEQELDTLLSAFGWEDNWQCKRSPTARAYRLLDSLDLGLLRHRPGYTREKNSLTFVTSFNPFDSSHVVFAEDQEHPETLDPVTASLLQARLSNSAQGYAWCPDYTSMNRCDLPRSPRPQCASRCRSGIRRPQLERLAGGHDLLNLR
jgi:hypothetical protein